MKGTKNFAEVVEKKFGRGAFHVVSVVEVRMLAWVTKTLLRIYCFENLRISPEGSSTEA